MVVILPILLSFFVVLAYGQPVQVCYSVPTTSCLGCICESVSHCNRTIGCQRGKCGPFQISRPYWEDGGSLTPQGWDPSLNGDAFAFCANDVYCAGVTVYNYLTKFKKDCNKDGCVDCLDFQLIHLLGGPGSACIQPEGLDSKYEHIFDDCLVNLSGFE